MMMRLLLLARALQNKEVGQNYTDADSHVDVDEGDGKVNAKFEIFSNSLRMKIAEI